MLVSQEWGLQKCQLNTQLWLKNILEKLLWGSHYLGRDRKLQDDVTSETTDYPNLESAFALWALPLNKDIAEVGKF